MPDRFAHGKTSRPSRAPGSRLGLSSHPCTGYPSSRAWSQGHGLPWGAVADWVARLRNRRSLAKIAGTGVSRLAWTAAALGWSSL